MQLVRRDVKFAVNINQKRKTNKMPPKDPEPINQCFAMREQGKAVLRDKIARLRRRADELQILHDMLPEKPTAQQDEALWSIAYAIAWK